MSGRWWLAPPIAALLAPLLAAQVVPQGPEFQINQYTLGAQINPRIGEAGSGAGLVVWISAHDGGGYGAFGRALAPGGAPLGDEFQINQFTTSRQGAPEVAGDGAGEFVVVWDSYSQDGSLEGVFARRFDSAGAALAPEFQINTFTTSSQRAPAVARQAGGDFVVVWASQTQDGGDSGVFGQRFTSAGTPLGAEFQVTTFTSNAQSAPAISLDGAGDFVVAWQSNLQDGANYGIFGQRFTSAGVKLGAEFQINQFTADQQRQPDLSHGGAGGFMVVWHSRNQDGGGSGIFGRVYDSGGTPLTDEFQVNTVTANAQVNPAVDADSSGNFVVVWQTLGQDLQGYGIFGRRFASGGATLTGEFLVNSYETADQTLPDLTVRPAGNFLAVWQSIGPDGAAEGIFGRGFSLNAAAVGGAAGSASKVRVYQR